MFLFFFLKGIKIATALGNIPGKETRGMTVTHRCSTLKRRLGSRRLPQPPRRPSAPALLRASNENVPTANSPFNFTPLFFFFPPPPQRHLHHHRRHLTVRRSNKTQVTGQSRAPAQPSHTEGTTALGEPVGQSFTV